MLFFFAALSLAAQTAAEMDTLLASETVSAAAASRFVLEAAGVLAPGLSGAAAENAAYTVAASNTWVIGDAQAALNLQDTAFLVMKAFNLGGGIMYSLFNNPRYAYREMVYRGLIQGRADPDMPVSGRRLLQIIGRVLTHTGEPELPLPGESN